MARLSSPESVMKKLSSIHDKIDELFTTVEQVKEVRGRINGLAETFEQKNSRFDEIIENAPRQLDAEKAKARETAVKIETAFQSLNEKEQLASERISEIEVLIDQTKEVTASFSVLYETLKTDFTDHLTAAGYGHAALKDALAEVENYQLFAPVCRNLPEDLPEQIRMLSEEIAWIQKKLEAGPEHPQILNSAVHCQNDLNLQKSMESLQRLTEQTGEELDYFSEEIAFNQMGIEKDLRVLASRLNALQKSLRHSLSEEIAALFSTEIRRLESEQALHIEELKSAYSDKKRSMNELIGLIQIQSDELKRIHEAAEEKAGQDIVLLKDEFQTRMDDRQKSLESKNQNTRQEIESLKNSFKTRLDELETAVQDGSAIAELENALQVRFEMLETAVKDEQKIIELEKSFRTRFEELETAARNDQKIDELKASVQSRLDELKTETDKAAADAFGKIEKLEKSIRLRMEAFESAAENDEKITNLENIIQTRLDSLETAVEDAQKIGELEESFQARFKELESAFKEDQQKDELNTSLQSRLDELKSETDKAVGDAVDKIGELEESLQRRMEALESSDGSDEKITILENSLQTRLDDLQEAQESIRQSSQEKIESLRDAFQSRIEALDASVKDAQKTDDPEELFQAHFEELETAVKDAQKIVEQEESFQARLGELEAAVKDEQKLAELETSFHFRLEELESETDKAAVDAFEKIEELEKSLLRRIEELESGCLNDERITGLENTVQARLDAFQETHESSDQSLHQEIESLRNAFQSRLEALDAAFKEAQKTDEPELSFQARLEELEAAVKDDQKTAALEKNILTQADKFNTSITDVKKESHQKYSELEKTFQVRLNELHSKLESAEKNTLNINRQAEKKHSELSDRNLQFQKDLLQKISRVLSDRLKQTEKNIQSDAEKTLASVSSGQEDYRRQLDGQLVSLTEQIKECADSQQEMRTQNGRQLDNLKQAMTKVSERQSMLAKALNLQNKRIAAIEARFKPKTKPAS